MIKNKNISKQLEEYKLINKIISEAYDKSMKKINYKTKNETELGKFSKIYQFT